MSRLLRSQDEDMEGMVGRHGRGGSSRRYWTSGGNPRESEAGQAQQQPPGEPAAKVGPCMCSWPSLCQGFDIL